MKILKTVSILLIAAICTVAAVSCAADKGEVWIRYKDTEISERICRFWLSEIKSDFVSRYEDITDTPACWNGKTTDAEGKTITRGEYVELYAQQYAKNVAVELQLFREYGLKLTEEETGKVDQYINELIYYRYGDSKSAFGKALKSAYGMSIDDLREVLIYESEVSKLEDYLFGTDGVMAPTDDELDEYYTSHYARFLPIVIYTDAGYDYNEDGTVKRDAAGNPVTRKYTAKEKEEKIGKAEAVQALIDDGEDFFRLAGTYSEELNVPDENGYYFSSDDIFSAGTAYGVDYSVLTGIMKQDIGSVKTYEIAGQSIVIVKRLEPEKDAYKQTALSEQFRTLRDHVVTQKNRALIESLAAQVEIHDDFCRLKTVDVPGGIF
ncbi:MAG: hypothetical protein IJU52_09330 [Clostridia bacterium]|nr:hypothetical protein [Clostridia bacterium]